MASILYEMKALFLAHPIKFPYLIRSTYIYNESESKDGNVVY